MRGEELSGCAAAHGQEQIGPERLVAGLDGEDVIGRFDHLVKVPLQDRLQRQRQAGSPR